MTNQYKRPHKVASQERLETTVTWARHSLHGTYASHPRYFRCNASSSPITIPAVARLRAQSVAQMALASKPRPKRITAKGVDHGEKGSGSRCSSKHRARGVSHRARPIQGQYAEEPQLLRHICRTWKGGESNSVR